MTNQPGSKSLDSPFGVRLRAARKMAGLSMEDLAKRLGGMVTKQAIGKYEMGQMLPTPAVLEKLIEVLQTATWGASPLKDPDAELRQPMLLNDAEAAAIPEKRGALHFLRKRHPGSLRSESEPKGADAAEKPVPQPCPSIANRELPTPHVGHHEPDLRALVVPSPEKDVQKEGLRATQAGDVQAPAEDGQGKAGSRKARESRESPDFMYFVSTDDRTGDFATLAERRARYLRASLEASMPSAAPPGAPAVAPSAAVAAAPDKIRFREGEKLPAKSASALRYRLADYFERYLGLESLLGTEEPFVNPIAGAPVRTAEEVEAAAAEVRRRWDLGSGPVVNLLGVLEDRGVRVFETGGIEGFEGLSGAFGAVPFVAVSRDFPVDRVRFTTAHELGHVLCGFPERDEAAEGACHAFAGAFLLPKAAAARAFGRPRSKVTLSGLAEIKTTFGISLQAIMYRARALDLVSDRQFRSFRETVKAKGWSVTEPVEYAGVERATRFRRLVHHAVASGILDVERAAAVAGVPAAELKTEIGEIF